MVIPVNEKEEKAVSTLTMWDIADISGGYQLIGSPILYSTQTVEYVCEALNTSVLVSPYVIFYDYSDQEQIVFGEKRTCEREKINSSGKFLKIAD